MVFFCYFSCIFVFFGQLKAETEQVRKELKDLEHGNANAMQRMENVLLPWKTRLEETVNKLDTLFAE